MFNPLLSDLGKLKDQDIEDKITELMKKYTIAAKSGQGMVCSQIVVILEAYRSEQSRRYEKNLKKSLSSNKNLDDYINIDH
ncbi:MAG: hypothetical protein EBX47_10150 [Synechococcaceae bacterium WB8_1B_057]|nr:hypothetical protein [Synechococcaceae bacterium WB6_1A_059]NDG79773.1 hypothetical protein [Synechococcaceae bacterium WB8_1B_057]